jgi:inosine/xanthosine triphosphatase
MGTVNVGSGNPVKVKAVEEVLKSYGFLKDFEVRSVSVGTGVHRQPKSFEETITGAKNRAEKAFKGCNYSIGIEDGIMRIPHTKSGWMNFSCCAVYDGKQFHIGISSGFEYPKKIIELVLKEDLDINQAFFSSGLTENPEIGKAEGAIGLLTKGRLPRKELIKQAIFMALIHLENRELYNR